MQKQGHDKEPKVIHAIGLGLRGFFADELIATRPSEVRWVELHPENYLDRGGRYEKLLEQALEAWPVVTHGLTAGFGNLQSPAHDYLLGLRNLLRRTGAKWHSDHLCFASHEGANLFDLLPLPFTREAVSTAVTRIREMRDAIECEIAVENVSYYGASSWSTMTEQEFLLEVLEQADAKLLLDVNNVYVNARNHGFDAQAWLDAVPAERVVQIHVAGHQENGSEVIIDTHAEPVRDEVYSLLEHTLRRLGPVPVLLERDDKFPPLAELLAEVRAIETIWNRATR